MMGTEITAAQTNASHPLTATNACFATILNPRDNSEEITHK